MACIFYVTQPMTWRGVLGVVVMILARGINEFGAVVILAYHQKVATVLMYVLLQGYGLDAAQPIVLIFILAALVVFIFPRLALLPEQD